MTRFVHKDGSGYLHDDQGMQELGRSQGIRDMLARKGRAALGAAQAHVSADIADALVMSEDETPIGFSPKRGPRAVVHVGVSGTRRFRQAREQGAFDAAVAAAEGTE